MTARAATAPHRSEVQPACPVTLARLRGLLGVSMIPGCWDKRFIRGMAQLAGLPTPSFTARQAQQIDRLAHKYRRQLPEHLVPPPPLETQP